MYPWWLLPETKNKTAKRNKHSKFALHITPYYVLQINLNNVMRYSARKLENHLYHDSREQ